MKETLKINKIKLLSLIILPAIIMSLITGTVVYSRLNKTGKVTSTNNKHVNEFINVYNKLLDEYYEKLDETKVIDAAINGMLSYTGDDYTIYMDENATEDLTDATNAWKTDITDFKTIKSYLVVLQNYEMQPGEKLDFTYDCKIPENLEHNESAYGTYVVYFNSVAEYLESTSEEATKVGVTTGVGANIEMGTKTIYQEKVIFLDF